MWKVSNINKESYGGSLGFQSYLTFKVTSFDMGCYSFGKEKLQFVNKPTVNQTEQQKQAKRK